MADRYLALRFEVEVRLPAADNFVEQWNGFTEEQRAKRALELSRNIAYGWNKFYGRPSGEFMREDLATVTPRHWALR